MSNSKLDIKSHLNNNFRKLYDQTPTLYFSPGRVNLIGEHTDYNNGFVMPLAISMGTYVAISKRDDQVINIYNENLDENLSFNLNHIKVELSNTWQNYAIGLFNIIVNDYSKNVRGANFYIFSDLPFGAGLSSSASFTTALGYAYNDIYQLNLSKFGLAIIAQKVEHDYIGTKCGLMDQMACIFSQKNTATIIDLDNHEYKNIPFDLNEVCLLICDTNIKHSLAESAYNNRRKNCKAIAKFNSINSLRELDKELLAKTKNSFSIEDYNLALHVFTENQRVLDAAEAMRSTNWSELGKLMYQSHTSLKDNYKVSCDELDYLVELAKSYDQVYGARMTGGGFGGSTIHLIPVNILEYYKNYLEKNYYEKFNIKPTFYISKASQGAHKL